MLLSDYFKNITPKQDHIGDALHDFILQCDPRIQFVVKYRSPFYRTTKNMAYISPRSPGIYLGLVQGYKMNNDFGLLTGDGKYTRHIYIPSVEYLFQQETAIKTYLFQAVELRNNA